MDAGRKPRLPPYVSYSTWQKLVEGLAGFAPDVIDDSYYRELRFSGSDIKKLRTSLRYLGLVDEKNVPSERLKGLLQAVRVGKGKEGVLREILHQTYPTLFGADFNLKTTTLGALSGRFEEMGAKGVVLRQCISFFLHMGAEAQLDLSPHLAGRSRLGIGRKGVVIKAREKKRERKEEPGPEPSVRQEAASGSVSPELAKLHPAIAGLLRELPEAGSRWAQKAQWKKAFEATLDLVYPSEVD